MTAKQFIEEEITTLLSHLENGEDDWIEDCIGVIRQLQSRVKELEEEVDSWKRDAHFRSCQNIDYLKANIGLARMTTDQAEQIQTLEARVKELEGENLRLNNENNIHMDAANGLLTRVETLEARVKELEGENEDYKKQKDLDRRMERELNRIIIEVRAETQTLERERDSLLEENKKLKQGHPGYITESIINQTLWQVASARSIKSKFVSVEPETLDAICRLALIAKRPWEQNGASDEEKI